MTSTISKYNLDKDKKVLGKKWFTTYSGWFSDEDNIQSFIKTVTPYLSQKSLDILYVASASGLLGERLLEYLKASKLTIVDMSQKHLNENKNRNTIKIKTDILGMNLKKKFDVILMRSSLDYFPSKSLQIKVLKIIKKHLKSDGIFINQPAYIPDIKERDIISSIYNQNKKIGKRLFQSTDIESIYQKAGFSCPQKIGKGKIMRISEKDHIDRYNINNLEIIEIQKLIIKDMDNAKITKVGYNLSFEFPIYISHLAT